MEEEIWKPIKNFEGYYEVSSWGRVRSVDRIDCRGHKRRGKILKQKKNRYGYLYVVLSKNGKYKTCTVHRLVAEAFLDNPNNYPCVNHIDCNRSNNRLENIEYCNAKQNYNHPPTYQKHINNKYRSKRVYQYTLDMVFVREWESASQPERENGFLQAAISYCCRGKCKQCYGYIWRYADDVDKEKGVA